MNTKYGYTQEKCMFRIEYDKDDRTKRDKFYIEIEKIPGAYGCGASIKEALASIKQNLLNSHCNDLILFEQVCEACMKKI